MDNTVHRRGKPRRSCGKPSTAPALFVVAFGDVARVEVSWGGEGKVAERLHALAREVRSRPALLLLVDIDPIRPLQLVREFTARLAPFRAPGVSVWYDAAPAFRAALPRAIFDADKIARWGHA